LKREFGAIGSNRGVVISAGLSQRYSRLFDARLEPGDNITLLDDRAAIDQHLAEQTRHGSAKLEHHFRLYKAIELTPTGFRVLGARWPRDRRREQEKKNGRSSEEAKKGQIYSTPDARPGVFAPACCSANVLAVPAADSANRARFRLPHSPLPEKASARSRR